MEGAAGAWWGRGAAVGCSKGAARGQQVCRPGQARPEQARRTPTQARPGQAGQAHCSTSSQAGQRTEVAAMRFSVKGVKSRMMWCTVICRKKGRKEDTKRGRGEEGVWAV